METYGRQRMGLASAGVSCTFSPAKRWPAQRPPHQAAISTSMKCNINLWKTDRTAGKVCFSIQQVEDDIDDDEACELVNGVELSIGESDDTIPAYLFKAVKNNNGTGILLLSDVSGFEDSSTREFAYRVACNGFNVLLPNLYRGKPWTKKQSEEDVQRVAKDIETATKWLVDEFLAAGISNKLAVMGFGFGGSRAIDVLARDQGACFATGASFYGTKIDTSLASNIKVPLLLVAGDNDPNCPVSVLKDVEKEIGSRGCRLVIFGGRGHGFVHKPESPEEDEDAEQAFLMLRNWLLDALLLSV